MAVRRRLIISGRVQGVLFRDWTRRRAAGAGVAGWARSLADGSVEVVREGEPRAVTLVEDFARGGSPHARVEAVDATDAAPEGQLVVVCAGLGAVLARSDAVFTTLKLIGAAYLALLGIRAIRHRGELAMAVADAASVPGRPTRIIREGFIVGVTNPKGMVMFTAVVPQFVVPGRGHVTLQLATLGAIAVMTGCLSDGAWALAAGSARGWLGRTPQRLSRLTTAGGVTMIAVGVALALAGRRT